MLKRLIPAILITALAPSAADAFTMAETTATMGAHHTAAGSGGTSWTSTIGKTRSALSRSGSTAAPGGATSAVSRSGSTARPGGATGKGWTCGGSKGRSAGRATGSSWASAKSSSSAARRR